MRDKGVLESVGPTLGKEQPSAEQAPLVTDESVQGVAGIVNNVQHWGKHWGKVNLALSKSDLSSLMESV